METITNIDTVGFATSCFDKHYIKNKDIFISNIKRIIGERHDEKTAVARSYYVNAYIKHFLIESCALIDYGTYIMLDIPEQKVFRDQIRKLALIEFDRIAELPVEVPEYMIQDAIKLLEKAGYMVVSAENWTAEDGNLLQN